MRILQLRKWLSARDDSGGKIRASGLARALSCFAQVDAIGFSSDSEATLRTAPCLAHYGAVYPITPKGPAARAPRLAIEVGRGHSLRSANFASAVYRRRVSAAVAEKDYDAIQVEELSMVANLPAPAPVPVVYSGHNVESALATKLLRARGPWLKALGPVERRRTLVEERDALRRAVFSLAVSQADKVELETIGGGRCSPIHVVPNCAGDDLAPSDLALGRAAQPHRIVFAACFSWFPNMEAARWFLADVHPHLRRGGPPSVVHFVGSGLDPALARAIEAAGCVAHRDVPDLRPHLDGARIAMVPLRSGGGTRLKIVEAWASGVPVVSTVLGAAGLGGVDGVDLLLADAPAAFAAQLRRVLLDDALYHRLRENGLRRAASMRWSQQAPLLAALYATLK